MSTLARVTELSVTSDQSLEDAINAAISRAASTLQGFESAWEGHERVGRRERQQLGLYKANLAITFALDDPEAQLG
jgi:flavin-binding protein dodecin